MRMLTAVSRAAFSPAQPLLKSPSNSSSLQCCAAGGKKRRGACGRRVLSLLLIGLVLSLCMGPAALVVSVTAAANLVHAGFATASHFSWARADEDTTAPAAGTSLRTAVLDTHGGGERLPLLLSWEPAWQRFDAYMTDTSSQQWDVVQQAMQCDEHGGAWCTCKGWGLHSARLAATLFRDSAVGWVGLLRTSSSWGPRLWGATVTPTLSLAKQQAALLQRQLLLVRTRQGRSELGGLVRQRGADARQLAVRLAAWANCVRQHVSTSGVRSLASVTQPAAGCWWQHMGQYLRRHSLVGELGEQELYLPAEENLKVAEVAEEADGEHEWAATGAYEEGEQPAADGEQQEEVEQPEGEEQEEAGEAGEAAEDVAAGEEAEGGTEDGEAATAAEEVTAEQEQAAGEEEEEGELPPSEEQPEEQGEQQLSEEQHEPREQPTEAEDDQPAAEEEQPASEGDEEAQEVDGQAEAEPEAAENEAAGAAAPPPLHLRALGERLTADELAALQRKLTPAQLAALEAQYAEEGSQQQEEQEEEEEEEQEPADASKAACPGADCKQWEEANPDFDAADEAARAAKLPAAEAAAGAAAEKQQAAAAAARKQASAASAQAAAAAEQAAADKRAAQAAADAEAAEHEAEARAAAEAAGSAEVGSQLAAEQQEEEFYWEASSVLEEQEEVAAALAGLMQHQQQEEALPAGQEGNQSGQQQAATHAAEEAAATQFPDPAVALPVHGTADALAQQLQQLQVQPAGPPTSLGARIGAAIDSAVAALATTHGAVALVVVAASAAAFAARGRLAAALAATPAEAAPAVEHEVCGCPACCTSYLPCMRMLPAITSLHRSLSLGLKH